MKKKPALTFSVCMAIKAVLSKGAVAVTKLEMGTVDFGRLFPVKVDVIEGGAKIQSGWKTSQIHKAAVSAVLDHTAYRKALTSSSFSAEVETQTLAEPRKAGNTEQDAHPYKFGSINF
jgi:hypothetical protein